MWVRVITAVALVAALSGSAAAQDEFILTAPESEAFKLMARHGLTLIDRVPERDVFLVRGPAGAAADAVMAGVVADPELDDEQDKVFIELNTVVRLPEAGLPAPLHRTTNDAERALLNRRLVTYHGSRVWVGYARQRAAAKVQLAEAHTRFGTGAGIVAVVDSGVEPDHPALVGGLVDGFDFTRSMPGGSEAGDLDAAHPILNPLDIAILENDTIVPINNATQAILEPGQAAAIVPGSVPATFGHGTMVASVVRLVAPGAMVMPLKAFDGNGLGRLYQVIRALYYARVNGATVVNLSLSAPAPSVALADALRYLDEEKVLVAAAVGNDGSAAARYPAALPEAFGVASVSSADRRSWFSSFGNHQVKISAPGEALVLAYPGKQYALGWGTSFATPLVAGAMSLMQGVKSGINWDEVQLALGRAASVPDAGMGAGRLNVAAAVSEALGVPYP